MSPARPTAPTVKDDERLVRRVAKSHNLTDEQYAQIVRILRRPPTLTEVGMFGVLWAEHCSYASSKIYLRTFPTKGKRILVAAGKENAGLVDIGDGLAVAFKAESHNHPSAVEPHAGAATGVGGIIRDIFTMGARPIALFDSLRFGPLNGHARTRFLFEGVVKGIADYGNSVGVPTVGGEIYFDEAYRENPLVNVMCIGVVPHTAVAKGAARGRGNPVIYVGSSTGRDGLGGASFASRELSDESEADRPAVQLGDPFAEKCLIEATLEALATGDVVGIQDMGAAGLTCSTSETASRGGCGMEIDVAKVPRRETGMTPYEVMLSESQERMLLIAKQGQEAAVKKLFAKWGLNAVTIGRVTGGDRVRVFDGTELVADAPVAALTHGAPVYRRPVKRPAGFARLQRLPLRAVPVPRDLNHTLLQLLGSPTIADKAAVYEQYDHMVQTNTVVLPGRSDAAVLRLKGTGTLLAATTDANGTYCLLDPYEGGKLAVAEAARNVACVGAEPLAVTDCLNFGSPLDPGVMWQFRECVRGISEACRAFGTPVTGGNVSLYNESPRGAVDPTPVIGMIGLIQHTAHSIQHTEGRACYAPVTMGFKDEGDLVWLLGETREELGASEYLKLIHHRKQGRPPRVDLAAERRLQQLLVEGARAGLWKSAHDCAEGGLAVAVAECCIAEPDHIIGAVLDLSLVTCHLSLRLDALLFGESAGRVVISCEPHRTKRVAALTARAGVPARLVGTVGGGRVKIGEWIDAGIGELSAAWRGAFRRTA
ncbi:MAG: phosphoribosylformylglycinamidine synthase subunit PurL [Candidatus Omnitrophica bacterium]|nr:phosphoribosylformylglycinamidine synthase subunit PurL [Candidatus Omnitrophota bacterium]